MVLVIVIFFLMLVDILVVGIFGIPGKRHVRHPLVLHRVATVIWEIHRLSPRHNNKVRDQNRETRRR